MDYPIFPGSFFIKDNAPIHTALTEEAPYLMRHQHDCIELAYVTEGEGLHYIGERTLSVTKGDLFLIPAYVSHVFQPKELTGERPLKLINCLFYPDMLNAAELCQIKHWRVYRELGDEFKQLLDGMLIEQQKQSEAPMGLLTLWKKLMVLLQTKPQKTHLNCVESNEVPIHQAVQHMGFRFGNPLPIPEISRFVSMSTRNFQRLFKSLTGRSYVRMLQEIRMLHSRGMLQYTDWSVQAVAEKVGIYDMNYFYRLFKEHFGTTPAAFRMLHNRLGAL